MNKHEAQAVAIELAQAALSSAGNPGIFVNESSGTAIADFIEVLTARLTDE